MAERVDAHLFRGVSPTICLGMPALIRLVSTPNSCGVARGLKMDRSICRLLRAIALIIGLAATLSASSAIADEADRFSTTTPIKHLVIIFQENETFDHYFGTYPNATNPPGEPEFHPRRDTPSVNGFTPTLLNFNPNGVNPFRYDRSQAFTCDGLNGYMAEQQQFDFGLMDQFVTFTAVPAGCPDYGYGSAFVMGYFDGNTVTALWNYAQHFAMSDNSYGTTFGSTLPGHINLVSGQTNGAIQLRLTRNSSLTGLLSPTRNPPATYVSPAPLRRFRCPG